MDDVPKRDTTQLFKIYAAIDLAVESRAEQEPTDEQDVTLLLPMYRTPGAHWFRQYREAAGSFEAWDVDATDPLALARAALNALAQTEPRCRLHARRLFAVGAAARTFPELEPDVLAAAAVGRRPLKLLDSSDKQAEELAGLFRRELELEATDADLALDVWWDGLFASSAVPRPNVVGPRPCASGLRWVTRNGDTDPVTTLRTEFDISIPFAAALRFLDPVTWECFPAWCEMKELNKTRWTPTTRRYRERVSFDCINHTTPEFTVDLLFSQPKIDDGPPRVARLDYRMIEPPNQSDVRVNEGWIRIRDMDEDPPTVRVATSKTIKFDARWGGAGLAVVTCHTGYLSWLEDLVCCASKPPSRAGAVGGDDDLEYRDVPFQAREVPRAKPAHVGGARTRAGASRAASPAYCGLVKRMVDETTRVLQECIDEFAESTKAASDKIAAKSYTADDLVQDFADSWVRTVKKGAQMANVSRDVLQTESDDEGTPTAQPAHPAQPAEVEL